MGHFIEGVVTEICTPFAKDGSIDWDYLRDMIAWQIDCGVRAFFVNGYAGECHELSFDEKLAVVAAVHEVAHPRGAKIMSCSFENSVELNNRLIDAYEEQGMSDCYCITAPPFFKFSQAALYDWSAAIIEHAKRPVYIYNCVEQAVLFDPDTLARLRGGLPQPARLQGRLDQRRQLPAVRAAHRPRELRFPGRLRRLRRHHGAARRRGLRELHGGALPA